MDQTHTRHRCAEALTRLAVCRFVIQATTGKENLDKTDFLHFSPVRSMPPGRRECAPAQRAGPMTELEMDSTWTRHIHDTAVLKR